jgi:hypothetical protein
VFEAFSKQYPNVNFLKCDVDAAKAVATKYQVTAMWVAEPYLLNPLADSSLQANLPLF